MTTPSARDGLLKQQHAWATGRGLHPDDRGYLANYRDNLRMPLSPGALEAFQRGSGSELLDGEGRPAKMRALHSSSALAVNVFDFWTGRNPSRLLRALGVDGRATGLDFECKCPTGARGTPPNLDVVLFLHEELLVGIESKFTEWMTPKTDMGRSLAPYLDDDGSFWSRAGFLASHELANELYTEPATARHYLDVPQLLKHALGLERKAPGNWKLLYVYFEAAGEEGRAHRAEIQRFEERVGRELRFRALRYQQLVKALGVPEDDAEMEYQTYLRERYGLTDA